MAGTGGAQARTAARGKQEQPSHRDHELFLQAFEKPTQIYRFLRTRNVLSPIFLNRTLSYMRCRMSRSHKARSGFKVDSMLERVVKEKPGGSMGEYMTLTFLGYHDKSEEEEEATVAPPPVNVSVETLLVKVRHKKRKDSSSACVEASIGSAAVPFNPSPTEPPPTAAAVSVASAAFDPSRGPDVKSHVLLLRVRVSRQEDASLDDEEPPPNKRSRTIGANDERLLGSELVVYDKHNRCALHAGDYELALHDVPATTTTPTGTVRSPHKALASRWETISEERSARPDGDPFEIFNARPTLKLRLSWTREPSNGQVARPRPLAAKVEDVHGANKENDRPSDNSKMRKILSRANGQTVADDPKSENSNALQIIYQFLYNNNSRQQTEACEDLRCPWCSLDCGRLYALLKHLKLCHSRFSFAYFPIPKGARIDVSINDLYDGSYAGSPHEACAGGGGGGPMRRTPVTHILVCRPIGRRPLRAPSTNNLAEFLESDDNEMTDSQRPFIAGHNRLYHHTITCLPIYPKELENDSEDETDPLWLQQKTMMMIDEFTDVNEGEKELMKMWNLHVMKYNFVGDCQIPIACQMFLQLRGRELLDKNLYRNFVLHMCSLHDFGLVTSIVLYQTVQLLLQMVAEGHATKQTMRKNILVQRENWTSTGMHQQPTVLLEPKPGQAATKTSGFGGDSTPSVRRKASSIQSTNNRTTSSNYASDAKKKADAPAAEIPQRRKSVQVANSVNMKSPANAPERRKSACTNGSAPMAASQGRKRLSLADRKNSA